ncbi:MAG: phage head spike fiber domain-containing protein [Candidatus Fervidibacter sp.]|uniref:phage head spike fiber domain-containing protein n=1 Tax=Candidatus Fervidibacter sp. TaxID=3100871 RepID=UPI004049EF5B
MKTENTCQLQLWEQPRNLLRNSHFWFSTNEEVPDWWGSGVPERIYNWNGCIFLEEGSHIPNTRAVRLFNPQNGTWFSFQSFAYFLQSNKPYTFSVYLKADRNDSPVVLTLGYDQSTTVRVSTGWKRFTFTATPKRGHWARDRFVVSISFIQSGNLWLAAPQLEEGETATEYTPLYRDDVWCRTHRLSFIAIVQFNAYLREPVARIWCENNLSQTLKVRCFAGKVELQPQDEPLLKGGEKRFIAFNISNLPPGTHEITVEAINEEGDVIASMTDRLEKLPTMEEANVFVQIDRVRRHLVVNGTPVFIFAQGIHTTPEVWWLDDITSHGFNAIVPADSSWQQLRSFLDEAQKRNLWVICWLRPSGKTVQETVDDIVKIISAFRDHPALIAWYLLDEPENWWRQARRKEEDLLAVYQAAKHQDPYRPVQLNWCQWVDGKGGYGSLQATDFGSLDHYPFGQTENPFAKLADFLWRMNRDCRPLGKPVAFWQQMYGYDDAVREPTAEEARTHTWLTLVTGSRLIYWFIYKPMSRNLWETMPQIASEVKQLQSLLTADDSIELAVGREGNVHYAFWRAEGKDVLLVVNAGYTFARVPIFARWILKREVGAADLIVGDNVVTVKGGLVWAQMPPLSAGAFVLY